MIIAPSKSDVGVICNTPVPVEVGPHAPVAEIELDVSPPKVIVNVPAVLPVTV
jgi:hypothetical protein